MVEMVREVQVALLVMADTTPNNLVVDVVIIMVFQAELMLVLQIIHMELVQLVLFLRIWKKT